MLGEYPHQCCSPDRVQRNCGTSPANYKVGSNEVIALGSDDPHVLYRLQALAERFPLTDLRLSFGYAAQTRRQTNGALERVSVTIPPRSLGRLRTVLEPIVTGRIVDALGRRPEVLL